MTLISLFLSHGVFSLSHTEDTEDTELRTRYACAGLRDVTIAL